ncbi:MAG: RNA 2',3'-cyclic phosphodiesterase [Oscillospiraceae bacterium]|nr:RNA 2',3'-cyclic phosphodiesterase [Oscillospiraceae bacterium]
MRLFIAVELSEEMKNALRRAQDELCDHGVRGRFTPAENMHLTLAFIGDYPDPEAVLDALSAVSFTPFEIELEGLGCFGDLWWAGLKDSAALESTARRVRRALAEHAIPFDRKRFSPHITLIRKAAGKLPGIRICPAGMRVRSISLMRSERGKRAMIYTELGTIEAQP